MKDAFPNISKVEVDSLADYLDAALSIVGTWQSDWRTKMKDPKANLEVWYRGQEQLSHRLLPSAYRETKDYVSAFHRFTTMAHPFLEKRPTNDWEWYFAAQHYGIPTRLLDWTEDVFVALHFALLKVLDGEKAVIDDWPTVWVMEAASLNKILLKNDCVYLTTASGTDGWLPDGQEDLADLPKRKRERNQAMKPVAILPPWSTPRIFLQRGRFTVHGYEKKPIEEYFLASQLMTQRKHIARIVIANPAQIASELKLLGFSKHHLYPEAANLAAYLKQTAD